MHTQMNAIYVDTPYFIIMIHLLALLCELNSGDTTTTSTIQMRRRRRWCKRDYHQQVSPLFVGASAEAA